MTNRKFRSNFLQNVIKAMTWQIEELTRTGCQSEYRTCNKQGEAFSLCWICATTKCECYPACCLNAILIKFLMLEWYSDWILVAWFFSRFFICRVSNTMFHVNYFNSNFVITFAPSEADKPNLKSVKCMVKILLSIRIIHAQNRPFFLRNFFTFLLPAFFICRIRCVDYCKGRMQNRNRK